jgi:signal transduction histidine kinase
MFTISQSVWFTSAIRGERYISRVYFSAGNDPYLILSVPSQHGIVAARLHLDVLREVVLRVRLGETGKVYIIDESGDLIADSDAAIIQQSPSLLERPEAQSAISGGADGWKGAYTNFNGKKVLGQSIAVFDGKWIIFVEISREEAFAVTRLVSIVISLIVLLVFAAAMLAGNIVLMRYIFKPIEILRNGTFQIGEGDLEHHIKFNRQDEITLVGEAFNEMARKLSAREAALGETLKKAVDVNRYKSEVLAHVSHDLRTPLGGIIGFSEILAEEVDGSLNAEQKQRVERVLVNAKRLRDMVETLLDQAQLERGTLHLHENAFATAKFIEPLHTYEIMTKGKEISLNVEIEPGFPETLRGDMLRLQEVLVNLVDNAIKFTRKGGITVTLFRPDEDHWAFSVQDTGMGIPADAHEYIFESFRQVDASTKRVHGGAGLGLSIVKQIVQLMEGTISLQSQIGTGSTFTVILPMKKGSNK